jgi:hypothetical protein
MSDNVLDQNEIELLGDSVRENNKPSIRKKNFDSRTLTMKTFIALFVLCLIVFAGCDLAKPVGKVQRDRDDEIARKAAETASPPKTEPEAVAEPKAAEPDKEPVKEQTAPKEQSAEQSDEPAPKEKQPTSKKSADKNTQTVKAEVGAGKKGHYEKTDGGFLTVPISSYFRSKEMVVFRIQIPEAMKLYKAENEHYPESQEIFEQEILKKNQIKLPELPQGEEYFYDPETGEVMIRKPKPQ